MANIKPYTDQISSARYGEEVRGSIVNALTAMNNQISDDTASAGAYAQDAAASAASADTTAEGLVDTLAEFETKITAFDTAESLRVTAEQNRATAEQARAVAELARENEETGYVAQARGYAEQAAQHASSDNARLSESWAIGGTGVRYGEDISNSKYFSDQSQAWATGGTNGTPSATNNAKYWSDQSEARANERGTYWNDQLAITGQSWTEGGTGTRQGEDTNNAKYWSEQAYHWYEEAGEVVTEGGVTSFNGRNGIVVPTSGDYTASMIPRGTGTVDSSLTTIESTVSAQGTRLTTAEADIDALETRMTTAESGITNLTNNKVDMTMPLLNFDNTATDPLTDDGALANALTALGILSNVIPSGGGSLYLKKALTELAKKLGELNSISGTVPVAIKGIWDNLVYTKSGNVVTVNIVIGNGNTFSGFDGSADIGTIPEGLRPKLDSHLTGLMRTEGTWSGSTYYPCDVYIIASSGLIKLRGTSAIANCKYFVCNGCYII